MNGGWFCCLSRVQQEHPASCPLDERGRFVLELFEPDKRHHDQAHNCLYGADIFGSLKKVVEEEYVVPGKHIRNHKALQWHLRQ